MPLAMPREQLVRFNGVRLSDHNRENVERSVERIGSTTRTARGNLRKMHIADKLSFSINWSTLPEADAGTVDGRWGAQSIINFYENTPGEFELSLAASDNSMLTYTVVFTDMSYTVVHRFGRYYYDISLSLEEV